ncbi:hypothetical protein [Actinacidiphila soli]|uniref:hypothetical protein n=1 Tax=Actinacidiphila soli TaxID=2487275 RepID=UPI000FCAE5A2|nr:hypothetical protein [Actinacidiphila soli]
MGMQPPRPPRMPVLTAEQLTQAAADPSGFFAEINPALVMDRRFIPDEAIIRRWRVDNQGRLTGEYVDNPYYGQKDDFTALAGINPLVLQWLHGLGVGEDLPARVRHEVEVLLRERQRGAVLEWVKVTDQPTPLADGHRSYAKGEGEEMFVLTRVALYVPFVACVQRPDEDSEILQGALTYVIGNVNQPVNRVQRAWLDVDDHGILNRLSVPDEHQLKSRMMAVGEWLPSDYPPGSPEA